MPNLLICFSKVLFSNFTWFQNEPSKEVLDIRSFKMLKILNYKQKVVANSKLFEEFHKRGCTIEITPIQDIQIVNTIKYQRCVNTASIGFYVKVLNTYVSFPRTIKRTKCQKPSNVTTKCNKRIITFFHDNS